MTKHRSLDTMGHQLYLQDIDCKYYTCIICGLTNVIDLAEGLVYFESLLNTKFKNLDITCEEFLIKNLLE